MSAEFRAFIVNKIENEFSARMGVLGREDLPQGEVLVKVAYSGVNYKDGLASIADGKVVRSYPFVPGVDLAGVVEESSDERFHVGDEVLATSYELGVSHFGGFSEYARVNAEWVVPKPTGLTLQETMALGTAGFTAALAIHQLEKNGLHPSKGPVLVTGATGGAGSLAVNILHKLGYQVAASTGKESAHAYLRDLGADEIIDRAVTSAESNRPMEKERWAGCIDAVGGSTLSYLIRTTRREGSIAAFGNTGGATFTSSVFPFILRNVNLLGVDSVYCPMELRRDIWQRLSDTYKPEKLLSSIGHEVDFEQLPEALSRVLQGEARGHTIIKL